MGAGGLKGHHVGLPGGVHRRMGDFNKMMAQAHQAFDQKGATKLGTGLEPGTAGLNGLGDQGFVRKHRITNAETALEVRRNFFALKAQGLVLQQPVKVLVEGGMKGRFANRRCFGGVGLGVLREGAVITTVVQGSNSFLQKRTVGFDQAHSWVLNSVKIG